MVLDRCLAAAYALLAVTLALALWPHTASIANEINGSICRSISRL